MTKLVQEGDEQAILKELMDLTKGAGPSEEEVKESKFKHKQEVADRKFFKLLKRGICQTKHHANYKIDVAQEQLQRAAKENASADAKLAALNEMQYEVLARALGSILTLNTLLLVSRVEVNILGRYMDEKKAGNKSSEELSESYTAFLSTWEYCALSGYGKLCEAVRQAVRAVSQRRSAGAKFKVNKKSLEELLQEMFQEVTANHIDGKHRVELLLPDEALAEVPSGHRAAVDPLFHEAQDMLESPHFLQVLQSLMRASIEQLAEQLTELAEGAQAPLAKLHKSLLHVSNTVLVAYETVQEGSDAQGEAAKPLSNVFLERSSEDAALGSFCKALYSL
jgi:hypothetical protein